MMRMKQCLISAACLVVGAAAGGAQAEELSGGYDPMMVPGSLPAVSQVNGKLSAFGGSQDGGLYGVTGSLSAPISAPYGVQLDGMVGSGRGEVFYGVGGHAFWRDPAKGLLGGYASYVSWDLTNGLTKGADVGKVGVEGEAYLGRFSLEGRAAYQFGTYDGFAGKAQVAYYPMDNLRLDAGARHLQGPGTIGMFGAEWQPHVGSGLTVFARGSFGGGDYSQVLGGVRYYFGDADRTLIQRHRQDDPGNDLSNDLITTTGSCPEGMVEVNGTCQGGEQEG